MKRGFRTLLMIVFLFVCVFALSCVFKSQAPTQQSILAENELAVPGNHASAKAVRNDARREELAALERAIEANDEYSHTAALLREGLIKSIEDEMVIESIALTKGFSDVCAIVSQEKVYVIVYSDHVSNAAAMLIKDTAVRQCDINVNDVLIILDSGE